MLDDDYTVRRPADFDYHAAIAELEEKVSRKRHATTQLAHFKSEVTRLTQAEERRRLELASENADVAKLQRVSPAVILYTLMGKKGDKLAKEEAEALAAAARYETVKGELDYAESRVRELNTELRRLGNCDRRLDELLEEKRQKRMAEDSEFTEKIHERERAVKAIERELREIDQALEKGSRVRGIIRSIGRQLEEAHELSVWDTGFHRYGGYMLDVEKHEHLDNAQSMLRTLGKYLQDFVAELDDVVLDERDIPTAVNVGEGLRALDLVFDNIFTDFAVRNRIEGSLREMDALLDRIEPVLESLMTLKTAKETERAVAEGELKKFIQQG